MRLASMDTAEAERTPVGSDGVFTSETMGGKRERAAADGGDGLGESHSIVG